MRRRCLGAQLRACALAWPLGLVGHQTQCHGCATQRLHGGEDVDDVHPSFSYPPSRTATVFTASSTHAADPDTTTSPSRRWTGEGPVVCVSLAEAQACVEQLWRHEISSHARDWDRHVRSQPPQAQRSAASLARRVLDAVNGWWHVCERRVLLPDDVLQTCPDAARFVLSLVRQATSAKASSATATDGGAHGWRDRFQQLTDDAIIGEVDEWILLHVPPPPAATPPSSPVDATLSDGVLPYARFLSLVDSYLRYHQGVTWGASGGAPRDRRHYRVHPWADQYCPEGREAQMPFVHVLQWMLARDGPAPSTLRTDGANRQGLSEPGAHDDSSRWLWTRFRALEPFRPPAAVERTAMKGFAALDVGCQSGFVVDLLLTSGAAAVLAVDRDQTALNSTESAVHDHMRRAKGGHGRELAAQHQRVQLQQCELLPAAQIEHFVEEMLSPAAESSTARVPLSVPSADVNAFAHAARRRRQQARQQGIVYAEPHHDDTATPSPARMSSSSSSEGGSPATFDLLYYHPACPSLWPVAALAEKRGARLGGRASAAMAWWWADVAQRTAGAVEAPCQVPWVLSPEACTLGWSSASVTAVPSVARLHRGQPSSAATTRASLRELVEQLTADVVQRSAGWPSAPAVSPATTSTTATTAVAGARQPQPVVRQREQPLLRDDGYVVLVLPRVVDPDDVLQWLTDKGRDGSRERQDVVSAADVILSALEGLYEPILRRAYIPSAQRTSTSPWDGLPSVVRQALACIDKPTLMEAPVRSLSTEDAGATALAAARLLDEAERLTRTVDVLVLRKSAESCARARAAVSATIRERAGDEEAGALSALRRALDAYERAVRATSAPVHKHNSGGDEDSWAREEGSAVPWRDSFEHNEYKPRSTSRTRYHWTDLVPSYSYLETDYFDGVHGDHIGSGRDAHTVAEGGPHIGPVSEATTNFLAVGHPPSLQTAVGTSMDAQERIAAAARGLSHPTRSVSRAAREGGSMSGRRHAAGRASRGGVMTSGEAVAQASDAFRSLFATELRVKRRAKLRKLALSPSQQQEWYVDEKLLKSGAAKVELMNALARWDLKDYD